MKKKLEIDKIIEGGLLVLTLIWTIAGSFPTGWIYDLTAGRGSEIGQKPDASVSLIKREGDIEVASIHQVPVTVTGDTLVPCPLMKVRDKDEVGVHTYRPRRSRVEKQYLVRAYETMPYPIPFTSKIARTMSKAASHNQYHLIQLEDGSYLGVYFDDYLKLQKWFKSKINLPVGYVRRSDQEERKMLKKMEKDYNVNTDYVLIMYDEDKVNNTVDTVIRYVSFLIFSIVEIWGLQRLRTISKQKHKQSDPE